jgi:hypothetical protein
MDIQKSTQDVMLNAIKNFAKEYEVKETETQLMIKASDDDCTPCYQVLVHNKKKKDVTFNEILNVKLDFLGREIIATPFIASALRRLRRDEGCDYNEVNVLIYKPKEEADKPNLYFFKGTQPIKPITMNDIFGDMDAI